MTIKRTLALGALLVGMSFKCVAMQNYDVETYPELQTFIDRMVQTHQFDSEALKQTFAGAERRDSILKAIARPSEGKPWYQYRELFVTQRSIDNGVLFWKKHAALLQDVENKYGVPASVIVGILGVETRYGENTGSYRVIDALSTLAFDYPPRSKFFSGELEQFLLMVREEHLDLEELKGSYAGAIGAPQFIPSSYRAYAVDYSGTGSRDLFHDMGDVFGSVANYFVKHGWQKGEPIAHQIAAPTSDVSDLLAARNAPKPKYDEQTLRDRGVTLDYSLGDAKVALVELEGADTPEYWIAHKNFYVITRYNHSNLYAMAVWQLSQAVEQAYRQGA